MKGEWPVVSEASGLPSKMEPRQGVTVSLTRTASFEERGPHPGEAWGCLPFSERPVLSGEGASCLLSNPPTGQLHFPHRCPKEGHIPVSQ